ncbi:MAG TPA: sulfatase [Polyangiaceae bacterium]|nr:sulfatase [Polyangiaceae bacterium]
MSRPGSLLALSLLLLTGCQGKPTAAEASPGPSAPPSAANAVPPPSASAATTRPNRPTEPLNVLLLTIDAMRADMPWQGYRRPIAPNLTRWAERAVVYEDYRSISSYTAQSVSAMLTGRYASTLYRSGVFFTGFYDANVFITEAMHERGIRTGGVHSHLYFDRSKNLNQGFDTWELVEGITFDSETDKNVTADKSVAKLRAILSDPAFSAKQFFLWAHFGDPHDQYVRHEMCPAEWGKKNRDRYDCEIYFVDHHVGQFLEWARTQPFWARTALIISSDHGEAFGEHRMYKHAFRLYDVLVRVPAFFVVPGAEPRRISARRTHIDLGPTIVDLMGLAPLPSFLGQTMVPEIFGEPAQSREPIVLELAEDSHNPHYRAVIQGKHKLIVEGEGERGWGRELYDLSADPGEERDLAEAEPETLARMQAVFTEAFAKIPSIAPAGGAVLHSGRVARGPTGPATDPKAAPKDTARPR